ncbi:MAG: hypothetical protein ACPGVT_11975 [Maricaulaceae bacterium]
MAKRPVYPVTPPGGAAVASSDLPPVYRAVGGPPCEAASQEAVISNDCSSPLPVASCPGAPLEVIIKGSDVPQIDVEKTGYLCSPATDTWVYEIVTFTDGVETARSQIDSGVDCSEPVPESSDIFTVENCVGGFIEIQTYEVVIKNGAAQPATAIGSPIVTTTSCGKQAVTVKDCNGNDVAANVDSVAKIEGVVQVLPCAITPTDQTHVLINGQNTNVPAGLKTVTINNLSGVTLIDGGFQMGSGRRADVMSYSATELPGMRGLLPAITLSGGTWQWTGLQPITEG